METLADGFLMVESARWHENRLWFAHWLAGEVIALDPVTGEREVVARGPESAGWSIGWAADGTLLRTGDGLHRLGADGDWTPYADLTAVAGHGWNELVVHPGGDVYVDGMEFDVANGGMPLPGVVALVPADGSAPRVVATDVRFPNGMVITPDGGTLVVAESFAEQLTAFGIGADGSLGGRRTWAGQVGPDGICVDAEGAIWTGADGFGQGRDEILRVADGGEVLDRIELEHPAFSATLGGPDGRTLFLLTSAWYGFEAMDRLAADRTGAVRAVRVDVPAATV